MKNTLPLCPRPLLPSTVVGGSTIENFRSKWDDLSKPPPPDQRIIRPSPQ